MGVSSRAHGALAVVAMVFAALLIVQVFLAGLGVFESPAAFETHRNFGFTIGALTVVMLILAIVGRTGRLLIGLSALTIVQMVLQSALVAFRGTQPAIAALHPVNGFLLVLVTIWIARTARLRRAVPRGTAEAAV